MSDIVITNQQQKQKLWEEIKKKHSHLESYCTIKVKGLEDDNVYFHPIFVLDETTEIKGQCDTKNKHIYALNVYINNEHVCDIYDSFLEPCVIGWTQNKEIVLFALDSLFKLKNHVNRINSLSNEFISNILVSNAVEEEANMLINEVRAAQLFIKHTLKQKKNETT